MLNVKRYVILKWGNKVVPINKMLKFITLKKGGDRLWVVKNKYYTLKNLIKN